MDKNARLLIADYIWRWRPGGNGSRATPIYTVGRAERPLASKAARVRELTSSGVVQRAAVATVAQEFTSRADYDDEYAYEEAVNELEGKLSNLIGGHRGSARTENEDDPFDFD